MAKTFGSKKQKGQRLEIRVAKAIRSKGLDPDARRMPCSGGFSHFKGDVSTMIKYHIECKNTEKHRLWEEWEQAEAQCGFKTPVLVVSSNFRPDLAIIKLDDLLNLLKIEKDYLEDK